MEQLNGTFLFDSMYTEDVEGSKPSKDSWDTPLGGGVWVVGLEAKGR